MANPDREAVESLQWIARSISQLLDVDGKGRNGMRDDLTLEKCIEELQWIERYAYDSYRDAAEFLGWGR